jgi:pyruvate dehydrogenase E1 component alpha subunit
MTPTEVTRRLSMLEAMLLIRAYEEALAARATPTQPGTCTSVGQEAAAVGAVGALEPRDRILTNHRSAGHLIARGADPGRLMAEVLGRVDGYCKGKSGSLHISAAELGVVLTSTIVGGELSLAPGVALAQKMGQGEAGAITAVFFGDGAACEGIFHEALNLAVTWQLPLLFVCENNQWQAFVARRETMPADPSGAEGLAGGRIAAWAAGHGLPTAVIDGNDVDAVHAATLDAVQQIRDGSGPRFLELVTYRQRGHFEPDDQGYVDPAERAAWLAKDPIARAADRLLAQKVIGPAELAHFRDRAAATVAASLQFAESSPWPDARELTTDVYV